MELRSIAGRDALSPRVEWAASWSSLLTASNVAFPR